MMPLIVLLPLLVGLLLGLIHRSLADGGWGNPLVHIFLTYVLTVYIGLYAFSVVAGPMFPGEMSKVFRRAEPVLLLLAGIYLPLYLTLGTLGLKTGSLLHRHISRYPGLES